MELRPTPRGGPLRVGTSVADALTAVLARSRQLGFLGPGSVVEQRRHAEAFLTAIAPVPDGAVAVDLGSGGGVPGLVLAMALPQFRWILLDGMVRRTRFLEEAVAELGVAERVTVLTVRAEEAGRGAWRGGAGLVVARSFGPPAVVAECAAPLLAVGGQLVVSEPPASDGERWPAEELAALGLRLDAVVTGPPGFARIRQDRPAPEDVPRRVGVPGKRPRWT